MKNEWFGTVRWNEDDLANALELHDYPATEENIAKLREMCDDGTIRKVWTSDKEVCFGLVGTVEDLLKEKVLEWCDYNDDIWVFIPYLGILQEANFGKTREEAVSKIK